MPEDKHRPYLSDWSSGNPQIRPMAWIGMVLAAIFGIMVVVSSIGFLLNGA